MPVYSLHRPKFLHCGDFYVFLSVVASVFVGFISQYYLINEFKYYDYYIIDSIARVPLVVFMLFMLYCCGSSVRIITLCVFCIIAVVFNVGWQSKELNFQMSGVREYFSICYTLIEISVLSTSFDRLLLFYKSAE